MRTRRRAHGVRVLTERLAFELDQAAAALLAPLAGAESVTVLQPGGNTGDVLIYAGTRALLERAGIRARYVYTQDGSYKGNVLRGDVAVIAGGGAWCRFFHDTLTVLLRNAERQFNRVVVYPSSFELVGGIPAALVSTRALVFAREHVSYDVIREWCDARLAHDCAFYYDFAPHRVTAPVGALYAYRTDEETAGLRIPHQNADISRLLPDLNTWLAWIAAATRIYTDRAHVMIAGAMLGRDVRWRTSGYHKVPAIAEHSLRDFPNVRRSG